MEIAVLLLLTVHLTAASPLRPTHRSEKNSKYKTNQRKINKSSLTYVIVYIFHHYKLEKVVHEMLVNKFLILLVQQVRCRHCPPRRDCPNFRGKKVKGHAGGTCSSTEDHYISFRRKQTQVALLFISSRHGSEATSTTGTQARLPARDLPVPQPGQRFI